MNVQKTAKEAVGLGGQSFFSGSDTRGVSAFPSQAKTTLTKYYQSGGNRGGSGWGERRPLTCFGCGGPHPWSEYIEGKHVVKCPHKLNPGVQDNAQRGIWRNTVLLIRSSGRRTPRKEIWRPPIWQTLTTFPNSVFGNKSFSLPQGVMWTTVRVLSRHHLAIQAAKFSEEEQIWIYIHR